MTTILIILLIILLIGGGAVYPMWPHSQNWGYGPSGGVGLLILVVLIMLFVGWR